MGEKIMQINKKDNTAVLLEDVNSGQKLKVDNSYIVLNEDIASGHKAAVKDINKGQKIIKYGFPIGEAVSDIAKGDWIHSHNMRTSLKAEEDYSYNPVFEKKGKEDRKKSEIPEFAAYMRENGEVGIRNEIWIIPTVGCINKVVEKMAVQAEDKYNELITAGSIDCINAFTHPYGCSQLGGDLLNTQKILAGLAKHPNTAGVLVVGLGCENNYIDKFKEVLGSYNKDRIKFLELQEVEDDFEEGLARIDKLIGHAVKYKKEVVPVSKIKIGLKCGGSDAFSGITANPLVGKISSKLVSMGGTAVLTEVPEMFGAEKILMDHAENKKVYSKIVDLINNFKEYFLSNNQPVYENPSPGNKEGGITTLEEKSLGCIQKGGNSIIKGVSSYGEEISNHGLQLLESPGNDLVSTTALTAAGAHLILFTTGRGTPFGAPVPTVKISTNTELYRKKANWIDFDAGRLLHGSSMEELRDELFDYILKTASGEIKSSNEVNDYREIAIWKTGVTL